MRGTADKLCADACELQVSWRGDFWMLTGLVSLGDLQEAKREEGHGSYRELRRAQTTKP